MGYNQNGARPPPFRPLAQPLAGLHCRGRRLVRGPIRGALSRRNGQELAVYFKSESKMPMKRWIHLGFVDDAFFKDSASLRIWVETRVEVLGLRYYEPDKDFWQWMEMDKRG